MKNDIAVVGTMKNDIAIVGVSCLFPQANDYRKFWSNLQKGICSIQQITPDRWDVAEFYSSKRGEPNKTISKWCGLVKDIDRFDNTFFSISPREAKKMDPQQRLLLEQTWHCFEDSGIPLHKIQTKKTNVYVGLMGQDYYQMAMSPKIVTDGYSTLGNYGCILANRISYLFNLQGASEAVETACASSLVALHNAKNALRLDDCDYAIAAGVSLNLHPWKYISFSKANMLSPDGKCKTFDKEANGYVPGDGVGVLLLQRLSDAIEEKNHIYGILKGSAVNHNGKSNSITAPRVETQKNVITEAYRDANASPVNTSYIETHGTGTSLGDPIEIEGLTRAFRKYTKKTQFCHIGSVKTNIGHLEAAAGIAGVIKTLLMMKYRKIPPSLNIKEINPIIHFAKTPFKVVREIVAWQGNNKPLQVGVSSFGFGGANSHAILESLEMTHQVKKENEFSNIFLLSAKSKNSLRLMIRKWQKFIKTKEFANLNWQDICATLAFGRKQFAWRYGLTIKDKNDLDIFLSKSDFVQTTTQTWILQLGFFDFPNKHDLKKFIEQPIVEKYFVLLQKEINKSNTSQEIHLKKFFSDSNSAHVLIANYIFFLILKDLGFSPAIITIEDELSWEGFVFSGMIKLEDALAVITEKKQRNDIVLSPPKIPVYSNTDKKIISPYYFTENYLEALLSDLALEQEEIKSLVSYAITLKDYQFTFKKYMEDWDNILKNYPNLNINTILQDQELHLKGKCPENIILALIIQHSLQRLDAKWDLERKKFLKSEAFYEILNLLDDEVISREMLIEMVIFRDLASIANLMNDNQHLLDSSKQYNFLKKHCQSFWHNITWEMLPDRKIAASAKLDLRSFNNLQIGKCSSNLVCNDLIKVDSVNNIIHFPEKVILPLWMKGLNVNWQILYPEESFQKLSLPTYCFDRNKFWIEDINKSIYEEKQSDPKIINKNIYKEELSDLEIVNKNNLRDDLLYEPCWQEIKNYEEVRLSNTVTIIFTPNLEIAKSFIHKSNKITAIIPSKSLLQIEENILQIDITNESHYAQTINSLNPNRIIFLWGIKNTNINTVQDFELYQQQCVLPFFRLSKVLSQIKHNIDLDIITQNLHNVIGKEELFPYSSPLLGLAKVLELENPKIKVCCMDVYPDIYSCIDILIKEKCQPFFREIAYRNQKIYAKVLKKCPTTTREYNFKQRGVYLIIGGAGGIGSVLCNLLAKNFQARIIIVGRSPFNKTKQNLLENLKQLGSEALYLKADITSISEMQNIREQSINKFGRVDGIIHSALVITNCLITDMTEEIFMQGLEPKTKGCFILQQLFAKDSPDFFLFFSSIISLKGICGGVNYTAGCAFQDSYTQYLNRRNIHSLAIGWGRWGEVGIVANSRFQNDKELDIASISTEEGLQSLLKCMSTGKSHTIVAKLNKEWITEMKSKPLLISKLDKEISEKNLKEENVKNKKYSQNLNSIVTIIITSVAKALDIDKEQINMEEPFSDMGVNSLLGIELINSINDKFGEHLLSTSAIFDYPDIKKLANYIHEQYSCYQETHFDSALSKNHQQNKIINEIETLPEPKQNNVCDEIAVIGMAGKFPGASNIAEFWENIAGGINSIGNIPDNRWDKDAYTESLPHEPKGGFLDDIDLFDPLFFNISPREAELMDPQQRLFLKCSWEALEDAGYATHLSNNKKAGIYVGMKHSDYFTKIIANRNDLDARVFIGNDSAILAARLSYFLNLKGPSFAIDSACSSSLVAIHEACEQIRLGRIDFAIAGGVLVMTTPQLYTMARNAEMLSPENQCKTFDDSANGFVPGEGVGVIILKPLRNAIESGDNIHGIIKSSGTNQDGKTNGITAPSSTSQTNLQLAVYKDANTNPETITYVEAHGTGTKLGDPIEIEALTNSYRKFTDKKQFCAIGSVKTNIGHTMFAAGVAGIIKVLLALKHKKIPPSLHFKRPNHHIDFDNSPFYVNTKLSDWETPSGIKRRAAISSFGFSGTNAHAVVEEYNHPKKENRELGSPSLIVFSAKNNERLDALLKNFLTFIHRTDLCLADIAYTLQVGRLSMEERVVFIVSDMRELQHSVNLFINGTPSENCYRGNTKKTHKETNVLLLDSKAGEAFIKTTIEEKEFHRIAQLWISGVEIDWELLYTSEFKPRRVSLPTYPFAKERYWIQQTQNTIVPKIKHNTTKHHLLVHKKLGEVIFPSLLHNFSLEEKQPLQKWNGQCGNNKPKRIHLPTYPFAKEKYWIQQTQKNQSLTVLKTKSDMATIHPLLHINTSNLFEQRFTSKFRGEEFFLQDHRVKKEKVLPGVAYLEMARAAAEKATEYKRQIHLSNIVWVQPIIVHEEAVEIHTSLTLEENEEISFEIYSGVEKVHSQGKIELKEKEKPKRVDIKSIQKECDDRMIFANECYSLFEKMAINYGAAFRAIEQIYVGRDKVLGKLVLPSCVLDTKESFVLHPSIMDAALQTSIGFIQNDDSAKLKLPFALEELEILSRCTSKMWAIVTKNKSNLTNRVQKLDIDLCDAHGEICIRMKGFSARILEKQDTEESVSIWEPCWKEQINTVDTSHFQKHVVFLCEWEKDIEQQIKKQLPLMDVIVLKSEEKCLAARFVFYAKKVFHEIQKIFQDKTQDKVLVQIVIGNTTRNQVFASLSGLLKTAHLENPKLFGQIILVDEKTNTEELIGKLRTSSQNEIVLHKDNKQCVQTWQECKELGTRKIPWKNEGVYLITGGMGGLGFIFAQEITQKCPNATVVLTGRSPLDEAKKANLARVQGAKLKYVQVDVVSENAVQELIKSIQKEFGKLNGIIHSAGIIKDNFITKKSSEEVEEVLAPKVSGVVNLDVATKEIKLDFFVLFSSNSAMGNIGQADYAIANSFMNHYAHYRNERVNSGECYGKTISINWPYWAEGGMRVNQATIKTMRQNIGAAPLPTSDGIASFYQVLSSNQNQLYVNYGKAKKIKDVFSRIRPEKNKTNHAISKRVDEISSDVLFEKATNYLKNVLAKVIKLPLNKIDTREPMEKFGIDSIMVLELTNKLEKIFGSLSKTLFFEYQTIEELVDYFVKNHRLQLYSLLEVKENEEDTVIKEEMAPTTKQDRSLAKKHTRFTVVENPKKKQEEDIAIIGVAGRYPQANNINEFWENLKLGKDSITEIPKERWNHSLYYDTDKNKSGKSYSKWGGFIDDVDKFDPLFFNISPREAQYMDPQERLFLECAYATLEDAGYTRYNTNHVGVFVGVMYEEYPLYGVNHSKPLGGSPASIANRVSYCCNFNGPSMAVDTMCSSSLTTIHLACESIKRGECSMAIAGGVNVSIHPNKYLMLSQGGFVSSKGKCESFGEGGDGYVPGEGVGAVLIKPLTQAIADNDYIYGIIKGTAINHGGKTNGYSVPNPNAQAKVIGEAFKKSGIDPRRLSYLEAHGTGTFLGDPIEITGLSKAFGEYTKDKQFCAIGSAKSNIGHCESAAGIAGVTKVLLQLKHKQLVPSLHSETLNANINFAETPFVVQQKLTSWEAKDNHPRIAGISSFGAGGSNAHVIIEEYNKEHEKRDVEQQIPVIIVISAKNEERLHAQTKKLLAHLEIGNDKLTEVAYTLQVGREAMEERLAIIVNSINELKEKLHRFIENQDSIVDLYMGNIKNNKDTMSALTSDDDMINTVELWLAKRKYSKLAEMWVKGLSVDWNKLYVQDRPNRVSLPTYPFTRERYWIPENLHSLNNTFTLSQTTLPQLTNTNKKPKIKLKHLGHSKPTVYPIIPKLPTTVSTGNSPNVAEAQKPNYQKISNEILQKELKLSLAKMLYMKENEIDIDKPFIDMGLDSVVGVEWIRSINEEYNLSITATKLYDYTTIALLAKFLKEELSKLNSKPPMAIARNKIDNPIESLPPLIQSKHHKNKNIEDSEIRDIESPKTLSKSRTLSSQNIPKLSGKDILSGGKIAIIGMSGRYPDANNLDEYWNNLIQGKNSICEIPKSRWNVDEYYSSDPLQKGKIYCKWLGALDGIEYFDPLFFQISPAEAEQMDPQHRLFLQEGYKAFEDAGYRAEILSNKKCGVYLGIMSNEYSLLLSQNKTNITNVTGNSYAIAAARIAYYLNLKGPAIPIDTACSSSLVAIHLACQALTNNEIDMALAGGVSLYLTPESYIEMCHAKMLSPEGQCKTFDDTANGFVPGEGVGTVVLKRLEDAERDNDLIYGVILGSGINQDGKTNGITAPSVNSQIELERGIYSKYKINPETISYVETHGTGTKLGDPIELEALTTVFREKTAKKNYCALASVKSNIGHTSAAAGVASIQKVLLSMKNKELVPSLNFSKANSHFDMENSPFYVNTKRKHWQELANSPRRACVSSFGFSGTNAHLVIEEYSKDNLSRIEIQETTPVIIPISARTREQLVEIVRNLLAFLERKHNNHCEKTMELEQTIQKIISKILGVNINALNSEQEFREYGLDMVHQIALMEELEDTYAVTLDYQEFETKKTIASLSNWLLDSKLKDKMKCTPKTTSWNILSLAYTLQVGREAMEYRVSFVVFSILELTERLQEFLSQNKSSRYYEGEAKKNNATISDLTDGERNNLIENWIKNNEIKRIAEMWVKGLSFDWNKLYRDKPNRISLPTYPFARERYWIPENINYKKSVTVNNILHPLIHENTSDLSQQRFSTRFTGKEFFLRDHKIRGEKVLPGVAHLEMVRIAAEKAIAKEDQKQIHLRDIVWVQPIVVDKETTKIHTRLVLEEDGEISFEIYSGVEAVHSQGKIKLQEKREPIKIDIESLLQECNNNIILADECYNAFKKRGIDYGIGFKAIEQVYIGQNKVLGKLVLPSSVSDTKDSFVLHPSMMDAALQATIGIIYSGDITKLGLPFALEKLEILGKCTSRMWVVVTRIKDISVNGNVPKLNIDLYSENGEICMRMKGFSFQVLDKKANTTKHNGILLASPVWQEVSIRGETTNEEYLQHKIILCEIQEEQAKEIGTALPSSECFHLVAKQKNIKTRYNEYAVQCFNIIQQILRTKPQGKVLVQLLLSTKENSLFLGLSGLLKTAMLENPQIIGQVIVVEANTKKLVAKLQENKNVPDDFLIKYEKENRKVLIWQEIEKFPKESQIKFKDKGVYLITGGMGGLGIIFAKEILRTAKEVTLILTGRSKLPAGKQSIIQELKKQGRVEYLQVDICNLEEVTSLIKFIRDKYQKLNGIIHSAGIISDNFILKKTEDEFKEVLDVKVTGTVNLDTASKDLELDFFVLFSSLAGAMGNVGQADYATANAFMDQFAVYRNGLVMEQERRGQTISINWPLWKDGGMELDSRAEKWMNKATGLVAMQTKMGLQAFYRSLESGNHQVMVMEGILSKIKPVILATPKTERTNTETKSLVSRDTKNLEEKIQKELKKQLAIILKLSYNQIDIDANFEKYGIDSILAIDIINHLEKIFGSLPKTLFFECPSIAELTKYFTHSHKSNFVELFNANIDISQKEFLEHERSISNPKIKEKRRFRAIETTNKNRASNDIAIIGISGRYPQSNNIHEFWENLKAGKDLVSKIPKERWDYTLYYDEDKNKLGKSCSKWGGFIADVDKFDPLLFNIAPRNAEIMDPQERLFLEITWELLENTGYSRKHLQELYQGKIGIYVGAMYQQYHQFTADAVKESMISLSSYSSIANRISHFFNFHGPSIAIDTMCSSAVVAIYMACESLIQGKSKVAIAGGVNLSIHPKKYIGLSAAQMIGSHAGSRSFAHGDGYIPAEGVGAVMLKPLMQAEKDRDTILAVIKSVETNHSGQSSGYSVPNPNAQAELIEDNFKKSGIAPESIGYIEAAANGSLLGDAIEIRALEKVFAPYNLKQKLPIGSVKSNMGHAEAASGMSQLTKVVLQLQNKTLVPTITPETSNPNIDWENIPFVLQQNREDWKQTDANTPRRAMISSFGAGGSNAHLILEEYIYRDDVEESISNKQIVIFSAKDEERLRELLTRMLFFAKNNREAPLANIAYTLQIGREEMDYRFAMVVNNMEEFILGIEGYLESDYLESTTNDISLSIPRFIGNLSEDQGKLKNLIMGEAGEALLKVFLQKGDLEKIALYWVEGGKIPWKELQQNTKTKKIILPTYPFAREKYWIQNDNENKPITNKRSLKQELIATPCEKRFEVLQSVVISEMASILALPISSISQKRSMRELRFDSLMTLELRNSLSDKLEFNFPLSLITHFPNAQKIAHKLLELLNLPDKGKDSFELTSEQQHIYFGTTHYRENYNIMFCLLKISGTEKQAIETALNIIFPKYTSLFCYDIKILDNKVQQVIYRDRPLKIELYFCDNPISDSRIQVEVQNEIANKEDFQTRVSIYKGMDCYYLSVIANHIFFDLQTVLLFYKDFCIALEELLISQSTKAWEYDDSFEKYIGEEQKILHSPTWHNYYQQTKSKWLSSLKNLPIRGEIGTELYYFDETVDKHKNIQDISDLLNIPESFILMALFQLHMHVCFQKDYLVFLVPTFNRNSKQLESPGCFMKEVFIESSIDPNIHMGLFIEQMFHNNKLILQNDFPSNTLIVNEIIRESGMIIDETPLEIIFNTFSLEDSFIYQMNTATGSVTLESKASFQDTESDCHCNILQTTEKTYRVIWSCKHGIMEKSKFESLCASYIDKLQTLNVEMVDLELGEFLKQISF